MPDISLLPENLRGRESQETKVRPAPSTEQGALKMHVPASTAEEDVEIIEVDESELGVILAEEPLLTRLTYQVSTAFDSLKSRLFKKDEVPPPKAPPQFFTPPKPGLVTKATPPVLPPSARLAPGAPGAVAPAPAGAGIQLSRLQSGPAARSKARIMPQAEVPKRVRVIKRVRKSVRVSLIPAEELALLSVDVGRRKWTLSVLTLLFAAIVMGGYALLQSRLSAVQATHAGLDREVETTRGETKKKQMQWTTYQDLQPRLALLDDILKNHMVISRVLDFLETRTLPDVSYRTASLSPNGTLTLDVLAGSFRSAARQLVSFEQSSLVKTVDATAFTAEQDGTTGKIKQVTFQLLLSLDSAPFRGPMLAQEYDVRAATVSTSSAP
ncbi:MAG TPA: hypothetical protein VN397_03710 [Candidatus Methylomirabilis sp.]|nr:hypothetical protein [Candidatus Methylomirabilis sp.]